MPLQRFLFQSLALLSDKEMAGAYDCSVTAMAWFPLKYLVRVKWARDVTVLAPYWFPVNEQDTSFFMSSFLPFLIGGGPAWFGMFLKGHIKVGLNVRFPLELEELQPGCSCTYWTEGTFRVNPIYLLFTTQILYLASYVYSVPPLFWIFFHYRHRSPKHL